MAIFTKMPLFTKLFNYVLVTTAKKGIDESHGISHSMSVLHFANDIYNSEVINFPILKKHERIIHVSAIIHDMCDKKYMKEEEGLTEIENILAYDDEEIHAKNLGNDFHGYSSTSQGNTEIRWKNKKSEETNYDKGRIVDSNEISVIKQILHTMSYSKVKANGYPCLGPYQRAYHIVREADLLSAYDFDRSMIYHMNRSNCGIEEAYDNSFELFQNRVLRHNEDGLFVTNYSKNLSKQLHVNSLRRIQSWQRMLNKPNKLV